MGSAWRVALIAIIAFAAAVAGVYAARTFNSEQQKSESELHGFLHDELTLNAVQKAKIEAIETRFAVRKKALELEMRAANARAAST